MEWNGMEWNGMEWNGMEIGDDDSEPDRMEVLSEVQELRGTGEAVRGREGRWRDLSGGVDALLDALFVVGGVGDNGEADWMEARLEQVFERIREPSGAFEMPKSSSQGRVLAHQAFLCMYVVRMFFETWKLAGYGAKVAPSPSA